MNRRALGFVAVIGAISWLGLVWLGIRLYSTSPPTAGFDLQLLIDAGRRVAAGGSPYDPEIVRGIAPVAENLFYSYPPPVAQALSFVAGVPSAILFVAWDAAAVAGFGAIVFLMVRRLRPDLPAAPLMWSAVAIVPMLFPFAIGLLFGNLDVWFPVVFGAALLAVADRPTPPRVWFGGLAVAAAAVSKLHPASLIASFVVSGVRSAGSRRLAIVAISGVAVLVLLSIGLGGIEAWTDYAAVVRAGAGAEIVDPRNAGPAAQIALLAARGGTEAETLARGLQVAVSLSALAVTIVAAWRMGDAIEGLAWATAASLVVLPVTWYHYPSALIPFSIAALLRSRREPLARRVLGLVAGSAIIAALAIAWLPLLWIAVGLTLAAVRASGPARDATRDRDG